MNRRTALKTLLLSGLSASVLNAYDKKLVVNTNNIKIKDSKKPTSGELKHSPLITVGKKDKKGFTLVEVNIGQEGIIHPSSQKHWIYEIELFADDKKVSIVSLEPKISRGYLSCRVDLSNVKTLKAISKCNLHGIYTTTIKI